MIREFGKVVPQRMLPWVKAPKLSREMKEAKEPLLDVICCGDTILVAAELPHVNGRDIHLSC